MSKAPKDIPEGIKWEGVRTWGSRSVKFDPRLKGKSYYLDGVKTTYERATRLYQARDTKDNRILSEDKYQDFIFLLRRVVRGQLSEEGETQ
jgi:hypothetical protein